MNEYEDIIRLPHHVSRKHPQMSMEKRAAQFQPFSALTGYEEVIAETGRLTYEERELDDSALEHLDHIIAYIRGHLPEEPAVSITWFEPDGKKEGGAYVSASGTVKRIDEQHRKIVMRGGEEIPIDRVYDIRRLGNVRE